ncbi:MAG TPA: recombinase family protein [Solirubrobacteraceae bacterium]|nr:recombinase family protein [Solirubrobacteraceae bacterium]
MKTFDGYVRVSRVMGREGDSYMSPAIQEADVRRWAQANGTTIARVVTDEDVSGGKAVKDRGLEELIDRIEKGASAGIVVHHIDRFGRDAIDAGVAIKRIRDAGGRFIATATGTDSNDPDSKMTIGFYLMMAEAYLDRTKSNWDSVKRRNVEERGLHVCAIPPFGYRRVDELDWPERPEDGRLIAESDDPDVRERWKQRDTRNRDARLVVEPREAEVIRTVFAERAVGQPWANIHRRMQDALGRKVSRNFPSRLVGNRVYLGEAHAVVKESAGSTKKQKIVKHDAHEAIVTPEVFAAANKIAKRFHPLDGKLIDQTLLAGIVTCASCGKPMAVRGKTRKRKGEDEPTRIAFYACSNDECESRASSNVELVDGHVLWLLSQDESGAASSAGTNEQRWLDARDLVQRSEADLEDLITDRGDVSVEAWRKMIVQAEQDLERARADLYSLDDPGIEDSPTVFLGGRLWAYQPWGEDLEADRRTLRRYVGSVKVKSCGMQGRWVPISERVEVTWADGSEPRIADVPETVEVPA